MANSKLVKRNAYYKVPQYIIDEININSLSLAAFDSRATNYPKEEVANYFLARQKDCVKNSIASVAQSLYSHKDLENKNQDQQQELIFQKGINWNDFDCGKKRGRFIVKNTYISDKLMYHTDNIHYPLRSNPNIGKEVEGDIIYNPTLGICADYWNEQDEETKEIHVVPVETHFYNLRNKWEVVETPMRFSEADFKHWLK
jgi:hypothetical protein